MNTFEAFTKAVFDAVCVCFAEWGPPVATTILACLALRFLSSLRSVGGMAFLAALALPFSIALSAIAGRVTFSTSFLNSAATLVVCFGGSWCWVRVGKLLGTEQTDRDQFRWRWALIGIAILIGGFTALRLRPKFEFAGIALLFDMFVLLRTVSFLWEHGIGRENLPSILEYIAWSAFPAMMFGPVMRLSDFHKQLPLQTVQPLDRAWVGLLLGGLAKLVSAAILQAVSVLDLPRNFNILLGVLCVNPWNFYLMSAGLANLYIASGCLAGLTVPPNYNHPFRATNLADFWSRWHMSTTTVFRETLFFQRWGLDRPNLHLNAIIVFVLVGAWHEFNYFWIIWGLLHGIGYGVFLSWRRRVELGKVRAMPRWTAWLITYLFVVSCWATPPQLERLLRGFLQWFSSL